MDSPAGWVARVAVNIMRDHRRRVKAEDRALERLALDRPGLLEGLWPPAPPPGDGSPAEQLMEQVASLPRRQRDVVALHYFADISIHEIAERLGVTQGSIKRSLFQARKTLQRTLGAFPQSDIHEAAPSQPLTMTSGIPGSTTKADGTDRRSNVSEVKGWHMAGNQPRQYEHGIAAGELFEGKRVAYVRWKVDEPTAAGFGTLMQMINAQEYLDQRIRFSAAVKATGVDGWAGLWMRVDGPVRGKGASLAFDNMQDRSIRGTTEWQRYEVVLDVAENARAIGLGVLLEGKGEIRVADFRFEPVSKDVPTTGTAYPYPIRPRNLDLSED
ncbi:MAG: RNA polymerase sigma factor [Chloroflexota bacterium]